MNNQIKKIIFRDHGFKNNIDYFKNSYLFPEVKSSCLYREAFFYINSKNIIKKNLWKIRWLHIRKKYKCQISMQATIGEGLRFMHDGPRVIAGPVNIGVDCTIGINTIIGYGIKDNNYVVPVIGDRVYIGHNSSVLGGIHIGDDVLIAPNSYVNKDVPSNSIVIGNNIIIPKEKASKSWLKLTY